MSETAFDSKAFIQARNGGTPTKPVEPPLKTPDPKAEEPKDVEDDEEETRPGKTMNRSQRRLLEQLGEARGRAKAYEEMMAKQGQPAKVEEKKAEDPEPKRADFQDDASYNRAMGRWDARQEAVKETGKLRDEQKIAQETERLRVELQDSHEKFLEDRKKFTDWDAKAKLAEDLPLDSTVDAKLLYSIAKSDQMAAIYYYFADRPEEWDTLRALAQSGSDDFIPKFHRLEGKVEKMYSEPMAAGATEAKPEKEKPKEERIPETRATAADRDVRKPRPSADLTPRGGSPVPDEPEIGSAAWMAKRNQMRQGK